LPCALFDALTRLQQLDLADNQLHRLPASIANLVNLTSLDLKDNRIGAEGAQALSGLVNLTSLDLWRNGLGDMGVHALKGLLNLTSLNLQGNRIGAEGAQALSVSGLVNLPPPSAHASSRAALLCTAVLLFGKIVSFALP
jgi:hypothetical protein